MHHIKNRFLNATVRLTAWYLAILMFISIVFSAALYQTSSRQFALSAREQATRLSDLPFGGLRLTPLTISDLSAELERTSRARLRNTLVVYNLIILVAGGAASFLFARRTLRPIENALAAQSRFTADASHELRTPLTAMKSEIEVALRDKKLTVQEARELLESNLEEVDKLEQLAKSLLQLARYEDGTGAMTMRKVSLSPLVEKTITKLQAVADAKHITLKTKLQDLRLDGDAAGLQELISILLDNAIKYSHADGEVVVRTLRQGQFAIIKVEDQGIGIKASELPHLFERFYRADTSRAKSQITGYGLGLSIAMSIAKAHQGSITVTSTPGKGSVFSVKIPLHRRYASEMPV